MPTDLMSMTSHQTICSIIAYRIDWKYSTNNPRNNVNVKSLQNILFKFSRTWWFLFFFFLNIPS